MFFQFLCYLQLGFPVSSSLFIFPHVRPWGLLREESPGSGIWAEGDGALGGWCKGSEVGAAQCLNDVNL